jgi:AraC-like DNA-binding protein
VFGAVIIWVMAGATLAVALVGLLWLRLQGRKRIVALQARLDEAYDRLGLTPQEQAPSQASEPKSSAQIQELPDPGRPTGEFTERVNFLLGSESRELQEYQVLVKHGIVYLRKHLEEPVGVAQLAKAVHASARTLQRAMREALACSPTEMILAVKMHEAKQLLKNGSMNVSQAGYEVGFEKPDHFSRRFKAHYGVPPSSMMPVRKSTSDPAEQN